MQFNLNTLKKLPQIDLVNFAKNLRDYLKLAIKSSGGHYASPIGAVGITVAIHYIFDSPDDIFVFDTGHQCYAHKIITGRHDTFESIRKANGISGFPEPSESNHDHFRVGHAGTAIAIAMGFSITPSDHWVIVIIGDSAFANGVSLESLLLIHKANRPVIIIVNDNGHSISDAVSSLKTMNSKRYEALAVAADIHFSGSIDGNEPDELANKLIGIKKLGKSTLLHVRTIKGYSDEIASLNPFKYHAISSAKLKSTIPTTKKNSQEILSDFIVNIAQQMKILFVSAGMAETAGFNNVTKNTNINYLDVGIAEHSGFTIAAAACRDFDLTLVHIYSTFLQRSADALLHDIGVNQAKVVLLVDRCGVGAEDGPTHHGINDLAILRSCPKMEIYSCSNNNLLDITNRILNKERSCPIAIRIFKGPLIDCTEDTLLHWPKGLFTHRNGNDLTILSHGRILGECLKAAELLKNDTINCNVIEIIKLHPIDPSLLSFLQEKGPVIIVEEHANNGSIGNDIGAIWNSPIPIKHLYITNQLTPHGDFIWQWQQNGLDAKSIYNSCKDFLKEIKEEK